jgi:hypothetical protein
MELQQLGNLADVLGGLTGPAPEGDYRGDREVRVVIPGPTAIALGIMSISWSQEAGCFYMLLDDEDGVEL